MVLGARTRGLVKKNPWTRAELASRDAILHHCEHCLSPSLHSAEPNTTITSARESVSFPFHGRHTTLQHPAKEDPSWALRELHPDPVDGLEHVQAPWIWGVMVVGWQGRSQHLCVCVTEWSQPEIHSFPPEPLKWQNTKLHTQLSPSLPLFFYLYTNWIISYLLIFTILFFT